MAPRNSCMYPTQNLISEERVCAIKYIPDKVDSNDPMALSMKRKLQQAQDRNSDDFWGLSVLELLSRVGHKNIFKK